MIKRVAIVVLFSFGLIGCGGGSSESKAERSRVSANTDVASVVQSGKYNLWEYMVPKDSHTNTYSIYSNNSQSKYQTSYNVKQNRVVEHDHYVLNEETVYEKYPNKIKVEFKKNNQPNGMYELKLFADIGDRVTVRESSCKLSKHYDTFELKGKKFNDVIEIVCGSQPGYYQRGVGEIAQIEDKGTKSIRVLAK
ncbi:MAG: hypothetical protein DSZ06_01195 [Sulfurospirillum sp.]|nr:MAG: hypothetical protein DSZ06_01195 [Sulfurospirillum sp.]